MKNFKDLLSEVAQPKSAEERRFKDLHRIEVIKHPVAPESVHTGEIEGVTKKKRPADQEGDANYDTSYAVKDKPFKMPRNIDEEAELDEVKLSDMEIHNKLANRNLLIKAIKTAEKMGGNMTGAVREIEKMKKGLSKHKAVQAALQQANESVELDEASVGDKCSCCDGTIDKDGKCGCGPDCEHCGGQHDVSEAYHTPAKESLTFKGLLDRIAENVEDHEEDLISPTPEYVSEEPQREIPMMMRQLHFIGYAADEIMEHLATDDLDPEEWWQNKLANTFSMMQTLYSYSKGSQMAMAGGYNVYEENELEEATFKPSNLKLKSGESVKLSMDDAKILNNLMKGLNPKNKKEMETAMMKDKKGFQEIMDFAREAL